VKFRLLKSEGSNHAVTKLDVVDDDGTICGRITVPVEETNDLLAYWKDAAPRSASALATSIRSKENALVAEMLAAGQRSNAPAPAAPRSKQENPAVSAMLRVAKQNRLTKQAILRGC
jgi:hypothetical protein